MLGLGQIILLQYLVKQGFVVISVDNRGTGCRGKEFKHATYLN